MAGLAEPKRRPDGTWGLITFTSGPTRWFKDDDGNELTFSNKAEAEKHRRGMEQGHGWTPRSDDRHYQVARRTGAAPNRP